ncbi:hypothetical protein RCL1_002875 [Eukaryota sp. TZLM3-RCL]
MYWIYVLFFVNLVFCITSYWSQVPITSTSHSYPCSNYRVLLEDIVIETNSTSIKIFYYCNSSSCSLPSIEQLNHAASQCCASRNLNSKQISIELVNDQLSEPFSFSVPVYILPYVHPRNFFHALIDVSASLFYTSQLEGETKPIVLTHKCPLNEEIPKRYLAFLKPFVSI